jgi:hypothetical protein
MRPMSRHDIDQIAALLERLDRLGQDAQELRQEINQLAAQRQDWPDRRLDSRQLPDLASAHDLQTPRARKRQNTSG